MRILISTDNYYPNVNGASYSAQRLVHYLGREKHEILVIAPSRYPQPEKFTHDGATIVGLRSMPLERIRIARSFSGIGKNVKAAITEFKPDVVHIMSHFAISRQTAKAAKKLGLPLVGTNHFMPENLLPYLPLPKKLKDQVQKIFWHYFRRVFDTLHAVTSPTQTAANVLNKVGLKQPIKVISNGIDRERFKPTNDGAYLKQRYQLPDRPILLFVGRVDKDKNLDFVLRSLPAALAQTAFHLVITGEGAEKKNLEALVKELGLAAQVTFTGFVSDDDLPNLYPLATCFIMPGTVELQSIVTLEAMATGLPVIAADAIALPELVKPGYNGYLYPAGDQLALSACLIKFFTSPELWPEMSKKSLETVVAHDIKQVISDFVNLYQALIKK